MRPTRTSTLVLLVAAVVLFVLSASGQPDTFWASGPSWLGWTGFIGVSICMLAADRLGALRARVVDPAPDPVLITVEGRPAPSTHQRSTGTRRGDPVRCPRLEAGQTARTTIQLWVLSGGQPPGYH